MSTNSHGPVKQKQALLQSFCQAQPFCAAEDKAGWSQLLVLWQCTSKHGCAANPTFLSLANVCWCLVLDLLGLAGQQKGSPHLCLFLSCRQGSFTEELLVFHCLTESLKESQQCKWGFKISPLCLGNTGRFKKSCLPPARA